LYAEKNRDNAGNNRITTQNIAHAIHKVSISSGQLTTQLFLEENVQYYGVRVSAADKMRKNIDFLK
jgi:hypothetical protein